MLAALTSQMNHLPTLLARAAAPVRRLNSLATRNGLVALDVAPRSVRAIRVRDQQGLVLDGFRVLHADEEDRPLAAMVREALDLRLGKESVAIALRSPEVTIRRIEVPPMTPKELREALPWEARRHIAGLADDAVLDAHILGGTNGDAGPRGASSAVLVASPRKLFQDVRDVLRGVDVAPSFVDVSPLAAMNGLLFHRASFERGPLALLELDAGQSWFSIFSPSDLILYRDLATRAQQIDQALASHFGLDARQVEALKAGGKLPKGETPSPLLVQRALATVTAELIEDLRSALLYLESRAHASLERVYWTGAHASLLDRCGIMDGLSAQSGLSLERWNPLQGLRLGLIDEIGLRGASMELSAAAGLVARFFRGE